MTDDIKIDAANVPGVKFLESVPREQYFGLSNGKSFGNLNDLYSAVRDSDDSVFYHHVTADRNDFASWIKACVHHDMLAEKLSTIKQKEVFLGVLAEEIAILKNPQIAQTLQYFNDNTTSVTATAASPTVPNPAVPQNPVAPAPVAPNVPVTSSPAANLAPTAVITPPVIASPAIPDTAVPQNSVAPIPVVINASAASSPAPIIAPAAVIATAAAPQPNPVQNVFFEFEDVLKSVIAELEAEILGWEG